MADPRQKVATEVWRRIFQDDPDGAAILEELANENVYNEQFVPGAPDHTAFALGRKSLVMEIMDKCGQDI